MLEPRKSIEGLAAELGVSVEAAKAGLAEELRALRARLPLHGAEGNTPATPGGWNAAMYAYDEALAIVGHMLGVPGAPEPEFFIGLRLLTVRERSLIEAGLAAAGLDLRPDADDY